MRHSIEYLRAVRHFRPDPVPRALVEQVIDVARWTGSARNRQPWRFVAVTDPETRRQLSGFGAYAAHLAAAPVVLVLLSADNGFLDTEFDLGRISQSICLAAAALGLGTCPTTFFPATNVTAATRLLGIPGGWLPRHAIALGYPECRTPARSAIPTGRLAVSELLTWA